MNVGMCFNRRPTEWPKWDWVERALLQLGHSVFQFNTIEGLRQYDPLCDIVLFEHRVPGNVHWNDLIEYSREKKSIWLQWYFDTVNWHDDQVFEFNAKIMRCMDAVLTKERALLKNYEARGVKAVWFDQGCPEEMVAVEHRHCPEFDVCLFGQSGGHYKQRQLDVMSLVAAGFKVAWAGTSIVPEGVTQFQQIHPLDLPEFMSKAAVTLCVDYLHDMDGYWSDRIWLALGAGACVVRRHSPGQPMLPYYSYFEPKTLASIVRELKQDFQTRREIGKRARAAVMRSHTIRHRAEEVIRYGQALLKPGVHPAREIAV